MKLSLLTHLLDLLSLLKPAFKPVKSILLLILALALPLLAAQPLAVQAAAVDNRGQFRQGRHSADVVEVKFAESAEVNLENQEFTSQTGRDISAANRLLKQKTVAKRNLLNQDAKRLRDGQKQRRAQGQPAPDLASYYRVKVAPGQTAQAVAEELKKQPGVAEAYPAPVPAPAPASPKFVKQQKYLGAAPKFMGINPAGSLPASKGKNVRVVDLEYSWSTSHEDLAKNRQADALWAVGTPADYYNDPEHGTAVSGIIGATRNNFGINGIASDAKFHMVNTYSVEYGWNVPLAITTATARMSAGDVLLIEQQTYGPNGSTLVPIEWIPSVYDAIKAATAAGIIVIEPAGNGNANLSDPVYGSSFPSGKPSSGAIMVGAGSACDGKANHYRWSAAASYGSNYGARVNVQGNGECIVTTGLGNMYGHSSTNDSYTNTFGGTSGASAQVAAVAAAVSSAYEEMYKQPASPALVQFALMATGTAQYNAVNPGQIGPLPNLAAAIKALDTVAPSVPQNVAVTLNANQQPLITWKAATDNSSIAHYKIYRDGKLRATTGKVLKFIDKKIAPQTTYSYQVQAVDSVGNLSGKSQTVTITTP